MSGLFSTLGETSRLWREGTVRAMPAKANHPARKIGVSHRGKEGHLILKLMSVKVIYSSVFTPGHQTVYV